MKGYSGSIGPWPPRRAGGDAASPAVAWQLGTISLATIHQLVRRRRQNADRPTGGRKEGKRTARRRSRRAPWQLGGLSLGCTVQFSMGITFVDGNYSILIVTSLAFYVAKLSILETKTLQCSHRHLRRHFRIMSKDTVKVRVRVGPAWSLRARNPAKPSKLERSNEVQGARSNFGRYSLSHFGLGPFSVVRPKSPSDRARDVLKVGIAWKIMLRAIGRPCASVVLQYAAVYRSPARYSRLRGKASPLTLHAVITPPADRIAGSTGRGESISKYKIQRAKSATSSNGPA